MISDRRQKKLRLFNNFLFQANNVEYHFSEMSEKRFGDKQSNLVSNLVDIECPDCNDSQKKRLEMYVFGIIGRMLSDRSSPDDNFAVLEFVKTSLTKAGRTRDAVILSELFTRLNDYSVTCNFSTGSLLKFLFELSKYKDSTPSLSIFNEPGYLSQSLETVTHVVETTSRPRHLPVVKSAVTSDSLALWPQNDENVSTTRELLYVLQGISGSKFDFVPYDERFSLNRQCKVSEAFAAHANKLCDIGWLYMKIRKFVESKSNDKTLGLIGQSLCHSLQSELREFDRLIAAIESQLTMDVDQGVETEGYSSLTLCQLDVWVFDAHHRLKMIWALLDNCRTKKGGALLSVVYSFAQHGDPNVKTIMKALLNSMLHPLYNMIVSWLSHGELFDDYNEFLISAYPNVKPEKLWQDKYSLNKSMLPIFVSESLANKMLLVGKSLNFISQVCHERWNADEVHSREEIFHLLKENFETNLPKLVSERQMKINSHLLDILLKKYKFLEHLKAFRRYLLFGQGDFIRHLMDILGNELDKPATELFKHSLTSSLETAIRATNAQYDDQDVLERLDVRLLEWSPGDKGWDVFSLHYHVSGAGPLSTVFTNQCILLYLRIFNFLWRSKRIEFVLSQMWIEQVSYVRLLRNLGTPIQAVLHKCKMLHGNMLNFVLQMQYYLMFEVLECSWAELLENLEDPSTLDHVIAAHQTFLDSIMSGALLEEDLHTILKQVRAIFDIIVQYQHMQSRFFDTALNECVYATSSSGKPLSDDETASRIKSFNKESLPKLRAEMKIISTSFRDAVTNLLMSLLSQPNELLQSLAYRLDFNDFYRNKDARLRHSYKHMRIPGSTTTKQSSSRSK